MAKKTLRYEFRRVVDAGELDFLKALTNDPAVDERTRKRAKAALAFVSSRDVEIAVAESGLSIATARKVIADYDNGGWQALITVQAPRGGDFLAHYDQGYWAERLARNYLDGSGICSAIPYGTSRSEPFTDMQAFREYTINELMLQAWSSGQRWKRPDIVTLHRQLLEKERGNDRWTPDLIHWDNTHCAPYLERAGAAIEVETSLWQVSRATVELSFTVKDEDLEALRFWVGANNVPLYILQVFYDQAYVLPFSKLEYLMGPQAPHERQITAEVDRFTKKNTYMVPLSEGIKIGDMPEPDVEGRVFKADNGKVTVYGRLTGSRIELADRELLDLLATGQLK